MTEIGETYNLTLDEVEAMIIVKDNRIYNRIAEVVLCRWSSDIDEYKNVKF